MLTVKESRVYSISQVKKFVYCLRTVIQFIIVLNEFAKNYSVCIHILHPMTFCKLPLLY